MQMKIWKIYIKTNLANNFIKVSKSFIDTLIIFIKKIIKVFGYISIIVI